MWVADSAGTPESAVEPTTVHSVPFVLCGLPSWLSQVMSAGPVLRFAEWTPRQKLEYHAAPLWVAPRVTTSSTRSGPEKPAWPVDDPYTAPRTMLPPIE